MRFFLKFRIHGQTVNVSNFLRSDGLMCSLLSAFGPRSRFRGARMDGSDDECSSSVLFLTRQIQTLKKRVRRFEDQFEQEMNYKVNTGPELQPMGQV